MQLTCKNKAQYDNGDPFSSAVTVAVSIILFLMAQQAAIMDFNNI